MMMNVRTPGVLKRFSLVVSLVLLAMTARAQNPVENAIKQLSSDNVRGYVQPFVNSFGANLNSGYYHSAAIEDMGFHLQFQLVGMGTLIGDEEKTYGAKSPYSNDQVQTATLFGGLGTQVTDPNSQLTYQFQNGQVKTSIVGLAVPQVTVGNIFGTQAVVRYVPIPETDNFPKTTLFGIGVRHSISRYLPTFPADLAAGIFYSKLTIGDIFEANALSFGGQISKSFSIVTLYGGLQYETSTMTLDYAYTGLGSTPNSKVHLDIDGENHVRATAGLTLDLVILHLNADASIGKVTTFSGGLGFGL